MREFPNATPRPWRIKTDGPVGNCIEAKVAQWPDGTDRFAIVANFQGAGTSATPYMEERATCEANGNLIVHAVNTLEERERLLEEAAEALRASQEAFEALAKHLPQVDVDVVTGVRIIEANRKARAFLAKLEARDA